MEEREAPTASEVRESIVEQPIDPSIYSVGPHATIPEESFDESEDVRSWEGGSTDFTFDEEEDKPVIGHLFHVATIVAKNVGLENGYRLIINNGVEGGQTVFHLHIHILAQRTLGWPPG